jgi:hypothetical protein
MDWFTSIAGSLSGLPWWAVLLVVLLSVLATKGVDGFLKVWGFGFERQKYQDAREDKEHDALVDELKDRIVKLESAIDSIQKSFSEERMTAARLLAEEKAAHTKCQLEQESLRGDVRVMQEQIKGLLRHDQVNKDGLNELKAKVAVVEATMTEPPVK